MRRSLSPPQNSYPAADEKTKTQVQTVTQPQTLAQSNTSPQLRTKRRKSFLAAPAMELLRLRLLLHLLPHRLEISDDRVFSSDAKGDKVLTAAAVDDDGSQRPPVRRICEAPAAPLSRVVICLFVCFGCWIVCFTTLGRQAGRLGREETRIKMAERRKKRQQLLDDHATAAVQHGRDGDPIATPIESEREGVCERASERDSRRARPTTMLAAVYDGRVRDAALPPPPGS
jgi:hypothetical protein